MRLPILFLALTVSMAAQTPAVLDLEREVSHAPLQLPEHSIFDSIQFRCGVYNQVTLDGEVTSERVREAAERDVRALPGVGEVVNHLKVHELRGTSALTSASRMHHSEPMPIHPSVNTGE